MEGREPDAGELEQLQSQVAADYERQTDIHYAAARLWVDAILDPADTSVRATSRQSYRENNSFPGYSMRYVGVSFLLSVSAFAQSKA